MVHTWPAIAGSAQVKSSGGKTYYGKTGPDVNHYLKWGFTEAANVIVLRQHRMTGRHVVRLYREFARIKGMPRQSGHCVATWQKRLMRC